MNISIQEVQLMVEIIRAMSQRNAIKAEEMSVVGKFFDKINKVYEASRKKEEKEASIGQGDQAQTQPQNSPQVDEDSDNEREDLNKKKKKKVTGSVLN